MILKKIVSSAKSKTVRFTEMGDSDQEIKNCWLTKAQKKTKDRQVDCCVKDERVPDPIKQSLKEDKPQNGIVGSTYLTSLVTVEGQKVNSAFRSLKKEEPESEDGQLKIKEEEVPNFSI